MTDSKTIKIWEDTWSEETHTTDYATKRIKSAKSAKLTPLKIDVTDCYGYFQGNHGRYETFLDYCPCGDFHRSKLPCKHIYRLAIELGLMDIAVANDANAIPTPNNERVSFDSTIDIVESLSVNAQHELLRIASNVRSNNPLCSVNFDECIIELLNSGIIIEPNPQEYSIKFQNKSDITEFLDSENIPYDKKAKKNELQKICIELLPEKTVEKFGKYIYISIPTIFSAQKIHYYLHRKYENKFYYTDLPNDDVTNQLIKRGYYSPK